MPTRRGSLNFAALGCALALAAAFAPCPAAEAQTSADQPAEMAPQADPVVALADLVQQRRAGQGLSPLARSAALDAAALDHALETAERGRGAPAGPGGGVREALVRRFYIPMADATLVAEAGAEPAQALASWLGDTGTAGALASTTFEEIGLAQVPNPRSRHANDAYVWVVVLAKPLRTPAESADSPRFGRTP